MLSVFITSAILVGKIIDVDSTDEKLDSFFLVQSTVDISFWIFGSHQVALRVYSFLALYSGILSGGLGGPYGANLGQPCERQASCSFY